jgi:TusA-related sulfurtransferase
VILLDVSGLEAPIPLLRIMEAMRNLKENEEILFIHRMYPCKLEQQVKNFGLSSEILVNEENYFKMKIFH